MERYRSGHNGADSKSVCAQAHGGSNPPLSARMRLSRTVSRMDSHAVFVCESRGEAPMGYLNYEFFDEFKALDNLCRDIYGESTANKLGVTLYLEDMDRNAYRGAFRVAGWKSDYSRLKSARNLRNELAHSRNSLTVDICSQADIDFVSSFRERILNQTDPLAMLCKQTTQPRFSTTPQPKRQPQPTYTAAPAKQPVGCFGIVAAFLIVVACIISFLL